SPSRDLGLTLAVCVTSRTPSTTSVEKNPSRLSSAEISSVPPALPGLTSTSSTPTPSAWIFENDVTFRVSLFVTPLPRSPLNDAALRLMLNGLNSAKASRCDTAPIAATINAKVTQNLTMHRPLSRWSLDAAPPALDASVCRRAGSPQDCQR